MRPTAPNSRSLWSDLLTHTHQLLAAGTLALGVAATGVLPSVAQSAQSPKPVGLDRLPDGVYLYGQTDEPDQIGKGYFVFEVNKGNVVGALYMPYSSFDCAAGSFKQDQLALNVVNSYDRTTNPFDIALETDRTVASGAKPVEQQVGLQGFQRLANITENDQRMLNVCKTDFGQRQAKGL